MPEKDALPEARVAVPKETEAFDVVARGQAERDAFSKIASENARKLDFLGFGLIALFGGLKKSEFTFPIDLPSILIWAGLWLTLALAADLLQYIYGALAFGMYARVQERKAIEDRPEKFPKQINWPTNFFFLLKLTLTSVGWVLLVIHLANNVS